MRIAMKTTTITTGHGRARAAWYSIAESGQPLREIGMLADLGDRCLTVYGGSSSGTAHAVGTLTVTEDAVLATTVTGALGRHDTIAGAIRALTGQ